jgi:aquaporin PIP
MIFAFGILTSAGSDFQVALSLYAGIFFVAPFTGGHLNPAVSLAKFLNGEITKKEFWIYAGS